MGALCVYGGRAVVEPLAVKSKTVDGAEIGNWDILAFSWLFVSKISG